MRRRVSKAYAPAHLRNEGSARQTVASLKTDLWYKQNLIWERWTWDRFAELCRLLQLTPGELASVVGVRHRDLDLFEQENHLFQNHHPNMSAAILLTVLEARCRPTDVVTNVFPDLSA